MKRILYILLIIICLISLIYFSGNLKNNKTIASSSGSSSSDLQLMARAINGEARGESYEGQVAVRSSNNEQSKE